MNTIGYRNKIGGAILAISLLFGIGMIASTTVHAQDRDGRWRRDDRYRDRDWRRNRDDDRYRRRRDDQYDRNDRYGRNGNYGGYGGYNGAQVELNQGYQAGVNTGSGDARRGQSYNPQRSHYYREARTQQFRSGFLRGYAEGYRQYGGYNNDRYRRNGGFGNILGDIFGRP